MKRLSLAVILTIGTVAALATPVVRARQGPPSVHYMLASPYYTFRSESGRLVRQSAYRACIAGTEWVCREFEPPEFSTNVSPSREPGEALRLMLWTLGNEGWELVSTPTAPNTEEWSYVFTRRQ